jgi:RHS repeat-associated protein
MTSAAGAENYTLDTLNRLTAVSYPNGDKAAYTYDAAGNRLTSSQNGVATNYSYDTAGRLVSQGAKAITYDAAGNIAANGSDTSSWDWAGRLSASTVSGVTSNYTYDGDGVRVATTTAGSTTKYVWDRASSLPLLVDDGTQGYVQTDRGILEQLGSTATYPLGDALGSVRSLETPTPSVLGTASYDAFGSVRSQSGQQSIFGFTGQQTDSTGLSYLRARYYNSSLGRFISPDSVQPNAQGSQGYNLYSYVANNPTATTDPSGHVAFAEFLARSSVLPVVAAGFIGITLVFKQQLIVLIAALLNAAVAGAEQTATWIEDLERQAQQKLGPKPKPKECCPLPIPLPGKDRPREGEVVYRVYDSQRGHWYSKSWTPENPTVYGPQKYRVSAGLPDASNTGDCLVTGVLFNVNSDITVKRADGVKPPESYRPYPGGLTEYVIENAASHVLVPVPTKLDPPYGGDPDHPPYVNKVVCALT